MGFSVIKKGIGAIGRFIGKRKAGLLTIGGFALMGLGQWFETQDVTKETIETWIENGKKRKEEEGES